MESIEIKECICGWFDLLGYGAPFIESNWELTNCNAKVNIERIENLRLSFLSSWRAKQVGTKLILNDGMANTIDTDVKTPEMYSDWLYFLEGIINDFDSTNYLDTQKGFPGIRGVITCGQRFSYDSCNHSYDHNTNRTTAYYPIEFQMNTAFSKAFIIEETGRMGGIEGNNLYIDKNVFEIIQDGSKIIGGKLPEVVELEDELLVKVYNKEAWFADIFFDKTYTSFKAGNHYNNKGIEAKLYKYRRMHSFIDELATKGAWFQSYRFAQMNE